MRDHDLLDGTVDETDAPQALRRLWIVEGVDRMRERFTAADAGRLRELRRGCRERGRRG